MKKAIAVQQQKEVDDDAKQAVIDNTHLYRQSLQPFTANLFAGTMSAPEYIKASQGLLDILSLDMTASLSSAQADNVRTGANKAIARATKLQNEAKTADEKLVAEDRVKRVALFGMQAAGLEVALKAVLVTPGMTSERAQEHTDAYMNTVATLAQDLGIEVQDSGWNAKIKSAGAEVARVEIASLQYETEQAAIDNAANNGTVDELTPTLQKRVFKQKQAENEVMVSDAVASGAIDEDQAALAMQQANAATYIKLGKYPDDIKSQATAVMGREFATDGVPNPQAIAVLTQWNEMRQDHPEVARTMFDEASEIKAQAIVELAGGNFASEDELAAALIASQRVMDTNAGLLTNSYIVDQGRITREVAGSVTSFLSSQDIGWIQGMWSPDSEMSQRYDRLESDEQRIFSDKAEERLNGAVMKEAFRLEKLSPNQTADFYAKMASDNVLGRASVIGDEVVIMDRGHSVLSQMFGDSASSMDKDGVEQEVILHAIRGLIESDPDLAWMGEATSREHDDFLLRGLWHTGDAIASMWGGSVNTPTLSEEDAERIDSRGVRPFVVDVADGKTVGIRMRYPNGTLGGYLDIDLPTAGAAYRADFLAGLAK
jgi:hypothetical protein